MERWCRDEDSFVEAIGPLDAMCEDPFALIGPSFGHGNDFGDADQEMPALNEIIPEEEIMVGTIGWS